MNLAAGEAQDFGARAAGANLEVIHELVGRLLAGLIEFFHGRSNFLVARGEAADPALPENCHPDNLATLAAAPDAPFVQRQVMLQPELFVRESSRQGEGVGLG